MFFYYKSLFISQSIGRQSACSPYNRNICSYQRYCQQYQITDYQNYRKVEAEAVLLVFRIRYEITPHFYRIHTTDIRMIKQERNDQHESCCQ